jgi:hypothetical protein
MKRARLERDDAPSYDPHMTRIVAPTKQQRRHPAAVSVRAPGSRDG